LATREAFAHIDLDQLDSPAEEVLKLVPRRIALQYGVLPLARLTNGEIVVAARNPEDLPALDTVRFASGSRRVHCLAAAPHQLEHRIGTFYGAAMDALVLSIVSKAALSAVGEVEVVFEEEGIGVEEQTKNEPSSAPTTWEVFDVGDLDQQWKMPSGWKPRAR